MKTRNMARRAALVCMLAVVSDAVLAAGGPIPTPCDPLIYDNGEFDLINGMQPALGWTDDGIIDDMTLPQLGGTGYTCFSADFFTIFGDGNLATMRLRIYALPAGGIPALGFFPLTVPIADYTVSVDVGNLQHIDTGVDIAGFDVVRLVATLPLLDIGAGHFGVHLMFPGTGFAGWWATAPIFASDCSHTWGPTSPMPGSICDVNGQAYTNLAFKFGNPATSGPLSFFLDPVQFDNAVNESGKILEGVETFEEAVIADGTASLMHDPLDTTTDNGFFSPGDILYNLSFQSNLDGPGVNGPNPTGLFGLAVFGAGFGGFPDKGVGSIAADASFDIMSLNPNHTAIGLRVFSIINPSPVEVRVFDKDDQIVGATTVTAADGTFIGILMNNQETFSRINLWSRELQTEGVLNVEAYINEDPCPWDCGDDNDDNVGIVDILALLGQWDGPGSCDFDGFGVGIVDFLDLLAHWGPCPGCTDFSVTAPGSFTGSTVGAGNDCNVVSNSDDHIYEVLLPSDGVWSFALCGSNFDTKIAVGTTCCSADVGSNDDFCGLQSEVTAVLAAGKYYVTVDGFADYTGDYVLTIGELSVIPPNDLCEDAIQLTVPSTVTGDTILATFDNAGFCGTTNTAPGIWYSVFGTGASMTASTCGGLFDYDTKISVFCPCDVLTCISGNNDDCAGGASGLLSTVTWCSRSGADYLILVHGYGAVGHFELTVTTDGIACTPDVLCGCGDPSAGDCYVPNPTPFCDDADCCNAVCAIDSFCCQTSWDEFCVEEAMIICP